MLRSHVKRASSIGHSGLENQNPSIKKNAIRCLTVSRPSKAVVRHICNRVTNLTRNTGLPGDHLLILT